MKKYFNIFVKTFFFISIPIMILSIIVRRRLDYTMGYVYLTIGTMIMSIFISFAITIFKSEKGKGYINAILGYLFIIPAIFVLRNLFGKYLFTRVWIIYVIIAIIGIIYGISLLVATRKYKNEVDELNRLLLEKEKETDDD